MGNNVTTHNTEEILDYHHDLVTEWKIFSLVFSIISIKYVFQITEQGFVGFDVCLHERYQVIG